MLNHIRRGYKVFDIRQPFNRPHFMMHGVDGSMEVLVGRWMEANIKRVHDGSCTRWYDSGFHVFPEYELAEEWLDRSTKNVPRIILPVLAKQFTWKTHAKAPQMLAKYLFVGAC